MQTQYELVHSLNGRVRVRIEGIRSDRKLAAGLEDLVYTQDGVRWARANPDCASLVISFSPEAFDPIAWLDSLNVDHVDRKADVPEGIARLPQPFSALRRLTYGLEALVGPAAQFLLGAAALVSTAAGAPAIVSRALITAAIVPIINRACQTLLDEGRLSADALDGTSLTVLLLRRNYLPAAVMTLLIGAGELIRDLITGRCQKLLSHHQSLAMRSAWLVEGDKRVRVPVLELQQGDPVVVYAGELVAFEGVVSGGEGTVVRADRDMNFVPQRVSVGDKIDADSIVLEGKLYLNIETIVKPRSTDAVWKKQKRRWLQRTRLHRYALHAGYESVWPLLTAAGLILGLTGNLQRALAILCFDFISGIRIAVPTAVLSALYQAGRQGILIRNAGALERLSEVDVIIFARSGVLTTGDPIVTDVFVCPGVTPENVTRLAAAAEQRYHHAAAYAICRYANINSLPIVERTTSNFVSGLGVEALVEGQTVYVGSTRFMRLKSVDLTDAETFLEACKKKGESRACVAIDGKLAGVIAYRDPIRSEANGAISAARDIGIEEVAVMTGASQQAADLLASATGISKTFARTMPEDKALIVRQYKQRGHRVAVVGTDVTDFPALDQADVAISLGTSADVTRFRADIVLNSDSLVSLVDAVAIARAGMRLARQNLMLVSVPNWLGFGLSAVDRIDFLGATLLNNGSVVVGAANGLRPLLRGDLRFESKTV